MSKRTSKGPEGFTRVTPTQAELVAPAEPAAPVRTHHDVEYQALTVQAAITALQVAMTAVGGDPNVEGSAAALLTAAWVNLADVPDALAQS